VSEFSRIAPSDTDALKHRTNLTSLIALFADEPRATEVVRQIASEAGVQSKDDRPASIDDPRRRLPPDRDWELFRLLRRRYDEVLDDRLLGDRTSRPIIQPDRPPVATSAASADRLTWDEFDGDVESEMQRLLGTTRYSMRLAAQEGEETHHLQRSTRNLAEAFEWYAMLQTDGRSVTDKTVAELQSLRARLNELIDQRLEAAVAS